MLSLGLIKRLDAAWLAGLGLLSACGPIPAPVDETGSTGSTSSTSGSPTSDPTIGPTSTGPTTDPTGSTTDPPPTCDPGSYCDICSYCDDHGQCVPSPGCCDYYFAQHGFHTWRCSPPAECYVDDDCGEGQYCNFPYCEAIPLPPPLPVCPGVAVELSQWSLTETPSALGLADLDGDGDLDLFAALPASGAVELAFNDGMGALSSGGLVEVAPASEPGLRAAAADLDGDGDADLAVARPSSGDLAIFFGEKGVFTPGPLLPAAAGVRWVKAGDVEGDGDVDLLASGKDGVSVSVWAADGMGMFAPEVVSPGPLEAATLRDATADGTLDLIAVSGGTLQVLAGAPDLTFQLSDTRDLGPSGWSQGLLASLGGLSPGLVALWGQSGRVSVWTGAGPGAWSIDRIEWSTSWPLLGGVAADFDGDGFEDVLSATPEPLLAVLPAQGDGALACADALMLLDVTASDLIATGDLDGGGDLEIVAGGLNVPEVSILRRP